VVEIDTGLGAAKDGQRKSAQGAARLNTGVGALTGGVRSMNAGLRTVVGNCRRTASSTPWVQVPRRCQPVPGRSPKAVPGWPRARVQLETGLGLLERSLPGSVDAPDGSPAGLAVSVVPSLDAGCARGQQWQCVCCQRHTGGTVAGRGHRGVSDQCAGAATPGPVFLTTRPAAGQAALLAAGLGGFANPAADLGHGAAVAGDSGGQPLGVRGDAGGVGPGVSGFCVCANPAALGDVGKGLAVLFLAIQISSSGGILPVELSGSFCTTLSPWLPLTWVVRALKAAMFGAYGGAWLVPALLIALAGLVALASACWVGRWRYVEPAGHCAPAIDF